MHPHIRVRMPDKPMRMRHRDPAQHHVSPGPKACTSKPLPVRMSICSLRSFCPGKVLGRGDLQVAFLARNDRHVQPRRARDLHVVRRTAAMPPVRLKDRPEPEPLRRLRPPEPRPVHRPRDKPLRPAPQRIRHRKGRGRRIGRPPAPPRPARSAHASRRAAPRHGSAPAPARTAQRLEPRPHARVPRGPAFGHDHVRMPRVPGARPMSSGMEDQRDRPHERRTPERVQRPRRTAWPAQVRHCFGSPPPARSPRPAATMTAATVIPDPSFPRICLWSARHRDNACSATGTFAQFLCNGRPSRQVYPRAHLPFHPAGIAPTLLHKD